MWPCARITQSVPSCADRASSHQRCPISPAPGIPPVITTLYTSHRRILSKASSLSRHFWVKTSPTSHMASLSSLSFLFPLSSSLSSRTQQQPKIQTPTSCVFSPYSLHTCCLHIILSVLYFTTRSAYPPHCDSSGRSSGCLHARCLTTRRLQHLLKLVKS